MQPLEGAPYEIEYDQLVMALGSVPRTLPIPGLADWAMGFKNIEEAIALRNRVLECLDIAETATDPEIRERNLTFVFVGGGYAGVEAMAETEDLARYATRYLRNVSPDDLRFVMVEASRAHPARGGRGHGALDHRGAARARHRHQARHAARVDRRRARGALRRHPHALRHRRVDCRGEAEPGRSRRPTCRSTSAVGWCATPTCACEGVADAWGAGDNAAVPDLSNPGEFCSPSAQHAVRQAKVLADNLVATMRGFEAKPYKHKHNGSVASLGLYKGVAQVKGVKIKGFPAWFLHRTYHMTKVPTTRRKVAVVTDWTIAFLFKRDVTSLWSTHEPQRAFASAARGDLPGAS